jgi:hypothetical protein
MRVMKHEKLILSLMLCCGCLTDDFENISIIPNIKDTTSVLIVGVENGNTFNKCTGSLIDANNMKNLLSNFSKDVVVLTDEKATINNFTSALKNVITNELAIIYYSGHDGSYVFNDEMSKLEDDG